MAYTAGDVMDLAARLLNDPNKTRFTYAVMLPMLKMAADDLDLELEIYNVTVKDVYCDITVPAGDTSLSLPCNFFVPVKLQERLSTSTNDDDFIDMFEMTFEPSTEPTDVLTYWCFRDNNIKFVGSTSEITVRLEYKRNLSSLNDASVEVDVNKAKNYLALKTASYCAGDLGNNMVKAESLDSRANVYLDKLTTALVRNSQGVRARRKPFRVPTNVYGVRNVL